MTRSEYYNLYKPEQYDDYDIDVFNANTDIIDQTMHELSEQVGPEADLGILGMGFGEAGSFDEDKVAYSHITHYHKVKGGQITIRFTQAVPAGASLNISGQGAIPIYYNGVPIEDGLISANTDVNLTYDGQHYCLVSGGGSGGSALLFYGTTDEYEAALAEGQIREGMIVAITDDFGDESSVSEAIDDIYSRLDYPSD